MPKDFEPNADRTTEIVRRLPEGACCAVEVGVWRGENAARILAAHPHVHLTLVDTWQVPEKGSSFANSGAVLLKNTQADWDEAYAAALRALAPYTDRVSILRMPSVLAAAQGGFFDLVFIDGDHSFTGVLADIVAWMHLVKAGGWIGGHDFGVSRFPGVADAVQQVFGRSATRPDQYSLGPDRTWWVRL